MIDSSILKVDAKFNDRVLYSKQFVYKKDCIIEAGKITLYNKNSVLNDNFAGYTNESKVIGIDTKGDVKLVKTEIFIGLGLLIPMAAKETISHRFNKIK